MPVTEEPAATCMGGELVSQRCVLSGKYTITAYACYAFDLKIWVNIDNNIIIMYVSSIMNVSIVRILTILKQNCLRARSSRAKAANRYEMTPNPGNLPHFCSCPGAPCIVEKLY